MPEPSSHRMKPPRGLAQMLSGALRISAAGDSKISVSVSLHGSYSQDLALPGRAAARRHEVGLAVAPPGALEFEEYGAAFRGSLRVHPGLPRAGIRVVDRHPHHVERLLRHLIEVRCRSWACPSMASICSVPRGQVAPVVGHEAIEPARGGVFGFVDDARVGIDGDRLVREATHRLERRRNGIPEGRHVEDVAVRLRQAGGRGRGRGAGRRLLAGQPRAPGCGTAGAVAHRPAEARKALDQLAVADIELQRRRAAAGVRVVSDDGERRPGAVDFVVPHQPYLSLSSLETSPCRRDWMA